MLIDISGLTKTYLLGEVSLPVLRGIDLPVEQGEHLSIMGPSGSGKSTLMNIIGCLDQPTAGSYKLSGTEVATLTDDELAAVRSAHIGFVFQQFNLLPRMSAVEQVELPMIYSGGRKRARALEMLDLVGLTQRAHHRPTEMSGGEQQRVAIARALVNSPSLILADEPTGALDSKTSEEIMAMLKRLNREAGITLIVVTHERAVAERADRIVHIRDGLITEEERLALPSAPSAKAAARLTSPTPAALKAQAAPGG